MSIVQLPRSVYDGSSPTHVKANRRKSAEFCAAALGALPNFTVPAIWRRIG